MCEIGLSLHGPPAGAPRLCYAPPLLGFRATSPPVFVLFSSESPGRFSIFAATPFSPTLPYFVDAPSSFDGTLLIFLFFALSYPKNPSFAHWIFFILPPLLAFFSFLGVFLGNCRLQLSAPHQVVGPSWLSRVLCGQPSFFSLPNCSPPFVRLLSVFFFMPFPC